LDRNINWPEIKFMLRCSKYFLLLLPVCFMFLAYL
jgi:hypothetical protein